MLVLGQVLPSNDCDMYIVIVRDTATFCVSACVLLTTTVSAPIMTHQLLSHSYLKSYRNCVHGGCIHESMMKGKREEEEEIEINDRRKASQSERG